MIRKMTHKDLDVVVLIEKHNFSEAYKKEQFEYELDDNVCAHLYVIEVDNKVVGYIDYWITFDSCQLCKIAIDETYKKQGYAILLMNHMIHHAKEEACEAVLLEVRLSNERAIRFYERFDFLEISIRKDYYNNPKEDGILMGKVLVGDET